MTRMQRVWFEGRAKPLVLVGPPWLKERDVVHHGTEVWVVRKVRFEQGVEIKFPAGAKGRGTSPKSS